MKRWSGRRAGILFGLLVGLLVSGYCAGIVAHTEWVFVAILGGGLLLWWLVQDVQLQNQQLGVVIEHTTFAGLEMRLRVMKKGRALWIPLKAARPLSYPPSIVALAERPRTPADDDDRAALVFRAALLDLLLKDLIEICTVTSYEPGPGRSERVISTEHVIVDKSKGWPSSEIQGLEGDILRTISNGEWKERGREEWLGGARVYWLVQAYYPNDVSDPQGTLLNSVEENAAGFGLCQIANKGFWGATRQVIRGSAHAPDLQADCQTADDLARQFKSICPEAWNGLYGEIAKGMQSRVASSD